MIPEDSSPLLPVRRLNEFVYCPRLFYLEWVDGEFKESADTLDGTIKHKRVDDESGAMPSADEGVEFHARSVMLSSDTHRLIAKMDLIDGKGQQATPVDYKRGAKPDIPEGAWPADRIQLCAQGIILRENGYECESGILYYVATKTRVSVVFTNDLVKETLGFVDAARRTAENGKAPLPLVDSNKCQRCSLVGICLPDETNQLLNNDENVRRIVPSLDEALPVYVQDQGAFITKSGGELIIKKRDGSSSNVKFIGVSQLSIFGNVQLTTQALHELCDRGIPICFFSYGGWFNAITHGMSHKNVELRRNQFAWAADKSKSLSLARSFVNGKIKNCRTMLRRNNPKTPQETLDRLASFSEDATHAGSSEELLGIEGNAARIYFHHFGDMLKPETGVSAFDFNQRNRRPPCDPVNALLSYTYAVAAKDFTVTLLSVGFDPYLGFYHAPRYGKPALALDTMEEFRPLICDSTVLTLINNGEVRPEDFIQRGGAISATAEARKKILQAYERRLDSEITHPIFKYKISYRRVMEVQARLLARCISGEITDYPSFCTR